VVSAGQNASPAGHGGLAVFSLWSIALAMASLIAAPALYLAVPLLLPLDLVPGGRGPARAHRRSGGPEGRRDGLNTSRPGHPAAGNPAASPR
jgi:hypothetical protein